MITDAEAMRRNLLDALPAIIYTASPDLRLDFCNQHAAEFLGIVLAEVHGYRWIDLVHPDDRQAVLAAWEIARLAKARYRHEHRLKLSGGEWRRFLAQALPLLDERGDVVQWYGVIAPLEGVAPRILPPRLRPARVDIYPFRDDSGLLQLLEVGMWPDRPDDPAAKRHPSGTWYRIEPVDGM